MNLIVSRFNNKQISFIARGCLNLRLKIPKHKKHVPYIANISQMTRIQEIVITPTLVHLRFFEGLKDRFTKLIKIIFTQTRAKLIPRPPNAFSLSFFTGVNRVTFSLNAFYS